MGTRSFKFNVVKFYILMVLSPSHSFLKNRRWKGILRRFWTDDERLIKKHLVRQNAYFESILQRRCHIWLLHREDHSHVWCREFPENLTSKRRDFFVAQLPIYAEVAAKGSQKAPWLQKNISERGQQRCEGVIGRDVWKGRTGKGQDRKGEENESQRVNAKLKKFSESGAYIYLEHANPWCNFMLRKSSGRWTEPRDHIAIG